MYVGGLLTVCCLYFQIYRADSSEILLNIQDGEFEFPQDVCIHVHGIIFPERANFTLTSART